MLPKNEFGLIVVVSWLETRKMEEGSFMEWDISSASFLKKWVWVHDLLVESIISN